MKKTEKNFGGFERSLLDFFIELESNNNKDWFHANKKLYEKNVKEPVKLFLSSAADSFSERKLPFIADPKISLFRINRDIRFSVNKEPYKTNLGIFFPYTLNQSVKKAPASVGLYFHIDPKESFIAGGIHMPEPEALLKIREKVADEWEELEKILTDKKFKNEFPGGLVGESLKRIPRGFPAGHPKENWLRLKEFTVYSAISYGDVFSNHFLDLVLRNAEIISPFLEYLNGALE